MFADSVMMSAPTYFKCRKTIALLNKWKEMRWNFPLKTIKYVQKSLNAIAVCLSY